MDKQQASGEQRQFYRMTQTPVPRLISSLAFPTIVSMMVTSIYNMADTYFVSQLGTSASGAVGIVFSLMAVIQAIGFTLGMGSGSQISRLLGQQRSKEATEIASSGFFSAILLGLLLTVFGSLLIDDLMRLLGATTTILPYARDYARYILFGAPVMAASFVLNNILRAEGRARLSMIGIAAGGVLNIALDPLFVFVFGLGIAGAAIATLISQCVSCGILLSCFLRGKSTTRLSFLCLSRRPSVYLGILKTGLPSFCRQGLASISTVALNRNAAVYGDAAVSAMSIVGKLFMLIFSALLGFGQGFQPVVGYNYGAKKFVRVRKACSFTLKVGTVLMSVFASACFFAAPYLLRLFIDDAAVIEIGTSALRAQCLAMPLLPLGVVCNMTFQTIGKSWTATFLSAARQGIFFLPLIYLLPALFGLGGIQITQPCADILTFLCCIPFAAVFLHRLPKTDEA